MCPWARLAHPYLTNAAHSFPGSRCKRLERRRLERRCGPGATPTQSGGLAVEPQQVVLG